MLNYKVCIKRTTVSQLLNLIGSLQSILHFSKGNSIYEWLYLYRYENGNFIVIEDKSCDGGIRNWINDTIMRYAIGDISDGMIRYSSAHAENITNDLYLSGVFRELGKIKLKKEIETWINNKINGYKKK